MQLRQHNNLLINKIWAMENVQQEASSGSLSFHPVKKWLPTKVPIKFCAMIGCIAHYDVTAHALGQLGLKAWRNTLFYYHFVVCYAFQSQADLTKSKKCASFRTKICIL